MLIEQLRQQQKQVRDLFVKVQGNARIIVLTEGVAAVSFEWYQTYISVYMVALGVTAMQIGWLEMVALFPFISALATMGMVLLAAGRMQGQHVFNNLVIGQLLSIVAAIFFILSPAGTIWWAVLWAVVNAVSAALFRPANESYWANIIGDRERALVFSASGALMSLFSLPAGPLAGALYTLAPRGPFVLGILLQAIALAMTWSLRTLDDRQEYSKKIFRRGR